MLLRFWPRSTYSGAGMISSLAELTTKIRGQIVSPAVMPVHAIGPVRCSLVCSQQHSLSLQAVESAVWLPRKGPWASTPKATTVEQSARGIEP